MKGQPSGLNSWSSISIGKDFVFAAVIKLQNHHPYQPSKQSHAEYHLKQTLSTRDTSLQMSKLVTEQEGATQREYLQHQEDLYHGFVDFKKDFDSLV